MMLFNFRGLKTATICLIVSVLGLIAGFYSTQQVMAITQERFKNLELFNKVLYLIESQYYTEVETEKLIEGAIKGMMQALDPHSAFLNEEVFKKMQQDTKGEFGGIGVEVSQKEGVLVIITPIDDTPAFRAGIMAGDRIIKIDGESTLGITMDQAVEMMRGRPGEVINLSIGRDGQEGVLDFSIKREIIRIQAVRASIVSEEYLYIRLSQFQKDAGKAIEQKIREKNEKIGKKNKKIKGIVLDLRSNPGGLLEEAVNVASIFIDQGIAVQTRGRTPADGEIKYIRRDGFKDTSTPLVVLINGASASASEIVAGAVQDHKRGLIMGSESFGKGSVQSIARIDETQGVKLTVAQYTTPSGRKIQATGIVPDILFDEYQASWEAENRTESRFIREVDLRGHLRPQEDKPKRERNRSRGQQEQKEVEKKPREESLALNFREPEKDYQVLQAINYLKTFKLIEKLEN